MYIFPSLWAIARCSLASCRIEAEFVLLLEGVGLLLEWHKGNMAGYHAGQGKGPKVPAAALGDKVSLGNNNSFSSF